MSEKLNDRQLLFAQEYLKDYNATQAAIRAGYSEKTAYSQGQRLLKNVEIKLKVREHQKALSDASFLSQERIAQELAKIAFYDVNDYVEVSGSDGLQIVKIKTEIAAERRGPIVGIKATQAGIEVKLADKLKALELLGRYRGMFVERQEVTSTVTEHAVHLYLPDNGRGANPDAEE